MERMILIKKTKKLWTMILAAALVVTTLGLPVAVYADPAPLSPSSNAYVSGASVSDLPQYSKVYFGKEHSGYKAEIIPNNGLNWVSSTTDFISDWIVAGSEDGALVLICDPAANYGKGKYNNALSENYINTIIDNLYISFYSGQNKKFTDAEISRMKDVEITCASYQDASNEASGTNVIRKMYAPNVKFSNPWSFDRNSLYLGKGMGKLAVDSSGLFAVNYGAISAEKYWCRGVCSGSNKKDILYFTMYGLSNSNDCTADGYYVPVFHLNLASVLFASTASAATSNSTLDANNVMTLRYDSSLDATGTKLAEDRIQSSAVVESDKITVTNPTAGEYLYIQYKTESQNEDVVKSYALSEYSKPITLNGVTFNENCRVWIEKKDTADNLVYAKNIKFGKTPEYFVELVPDYVKGKALILAYSNEAIGLKYNGKLMYKLNNSDYAASGTDVTYTNVYGITADNPSATSLNLEGVKSQIELASDPVIELDCGNYDVNGTNKLDISDAVAAMCVYNVYDKCFDGTKASWDKVILKADVNHDKLVDFDDVACVLNHSL